MRLVVLALRRLGLLYLSRHQPAIDHEVAFLDRSRRGIVDRRWRAIPPTGARMVDALTNGLMQIAWMAICAPPLILICMLRSLRRLAPFSMLSLTLFIYSFLVGTRRTRAIARPPRPHDRPTVPLTHRTLHAVVVYGALSPLFAKDDVRAAPNDWGSFPIFIAMSIYAFEGIGLVLPLENAARNKQGFPLLYSTGLGMVATLNTAFGIFGYISFGAAIETVALLNVPEVRAAHH